MISASYVDGLELRIKELTLSNQNLTTALQKVSDYNLRLEESQKSFISALAKSDEYITKLENERDALVAKLSMVIAAWNGYDYDAINAEINKTPQQCIAEIKAEAGRAGYHEALQEHSGATTSAEDYQLADQYAARVRQGGE